MTYNKDLQEDKKNLFEAFDIMEEIIDIMREFLPTVKPKHKNMARAIKNSYSYATHLVDYLVKNGVFFRDAHGIISALVKYCEQHSKYFHELTLAEFRQFSEKFGEEVLDFFKN